MFLIFLLQQIDEINFLVFLFLPSFGLKLGFSEFGSDFALLFQVSMKTEVTWVRDMLHGDDAYELRLKLLKQVPEEYPYKDDE